MITHHRIHSIKQPNDSEVILKIKYLFLTLFFISFAHVNIVHGQASLSPRIANYIMDIQLDVSQNKLYGKTVLTWQNPSSDEIDHLLFHMYYNAFRNSKSTFFVERGVPEFLTKNIDQDCGWGWSHINKISDVNGHEISGAMSYIQTDDNNVEDKTVLKLILPEPVKANGRIELTIEWEAKIPKTMPRTGYNKDFYFFAQWFPKLGVYEPAGMRYATEGQWNCHQYHSAGEYYADFGNYKVNLTVPEDHTVAATGQLMGQKKKGNLRTWSFVANDVIDFTWTSSPQYVITEENYKNTEIKLYTYPHKQYLAERYLPTIKYCMAYLDEHVGEYPYPTLSIIDPPIYGMYTGGMEYPTLITSLSFCFFPDGFKTPEILVVHEFIHQYFMQMIATHEVEEAWMDEGLTTYFEGRILDSYMTPHTSTIDFWGVKIGNKEWNRHEFFSVGNPQIASNARKSWQYKHGGYGTISYNKTALWLQTLEGLVGIKTMDKVMKTYFQEWKFKHPARQDFIDIANEVITKDHPNKFPQGMDWYFEQVLYGTGLCDYKIHSIENNKSTEQRGFFKDHNQCETNSEDIDSYTSTVILHRLGEINVPVEIEVKYENGEQQLFNWDGKDRSSEIVIYTKSKIISATIDPNRKISLDKNLLNNSLTTKPRYAKTRPLSAKLVTATQHLLELVSFVI